MKKLLLTALFTFTTAFLHSSAISQETKKTMQSANNMVIFQTSLGDITIELYPDKAPATVENFLRYVNDKFFDGTIFHRVIPQFVIQGGGFTPAMQQKPTQPPIKNEADNGLKNRVGTLSMARTSDPNSATSQFFINLKDNAFLDFKNKSPQGWGYAVFGKVVKGMDVVEKIAKVKTGNKGPHRDVPLQAVEVKKAFVQTADAPKDAAKDKPKPAN